MIFPLSLWLTHPKVTLVFLSISSKDQLVPRPLLKGGTARNARLRWPPVWSDRSLSHSSLTLPVPPAKWSTCLRVVVSVFAFKKTQAETLALRGHVEVTRGTRSRQRVLWLLRQVAGGILHSVTAGANTKRKIRLSASPPFSQSI